MRRLLLALLLVPACLEYEIRVTTVVQPDGSAVRTVSIRARDDGKSADPWRRLRQPAHPYALEGDPDKGFVGTARLPPGCHPSGLRVLLGGLVDDDEASRKDLPAAEGTVDIRATNLVVGTLYRYEERIALGTDPARFREELPRWLDTGLRLLVEALSTRFEDVDFGPVEAHARAEVLPAVRAAIVNLHHALTAMTMELGPFASGAGPEAFRRSEFWPAVVRELEPFGIDTRTLGDEDSLEKAFGTLRARLAERFVAPLPEGQRGKVRDALLSDEELDFDRAGEKLWPGDDGKKLGRELASFAASCAGAYAVYGIFDDFDMRFRVEMPGTPLRTDGDLTSLPAIEWTVPKPAMIPPLLRALSFAPAKGSPPDGWDSATLARIERALGNLAPEARAAVEVVVAGVLAGGRRDETGLTEEAQKACKVICDALEAAKARASK